MVQILLRVKDAMSVFGCLIVTNVTTVSCASIVEIYGFVAIAWDAVIVLDVPIYEKRVIVFYKNNVTTSAPTINEISFM